MPPLNWSHFKSKFSGKPDEDAEGHLLRTNDWMDTHRFQEDDKVQRFCLTLTGEERLWYESLRPINADWTELQNSFRQQYSKIGNTREQLFHTWRFFFHFNKQTETIDAYIHHIRQVTILLHYEEPQILEVFKKYPSYKTLLGSFPISQLMISSRASKENSDKGENRQTISRTVSLHSIHEL